ncbi:MAG TPA: hypothetical protein VMV18_13310, partial [bacterium]|nr:hypothetical protein [bacterium]
ADLLLPLAAATNGTFSFPVPQIPGGATYGFLEESSASSQLTYAFLLNAGTKDVSVPDVPAVQLPLESATIGLDAPLAIHMDPGLVSVNIFDIDGGTFTLIVVSQEPQFTLREIGMEELGFVVPGHSPFTVTWLPVVYGLTPSLDDAFAPDIVLGDRAFGFAQQRDFVVQP